MLKLELLYHYSVRRYNVSCMGPEGHEGSGVRTLLVLRRISSRIVLEFERRTSSRALALETKCADQQSASVNSCIS